MTETRLDLAKNTLVVLTIVLLIGSTLWILRPFLGATIWAVMVVVATWPALLWFEARLWRRRSLAVLVMVLILLLLFVLPLTMAISTIAANADEVVAWFRGLIAKGPPQLPEWVGGLPFVGPKITTAWEELVASGVAGVEAKVTPYASQVTGWLFSQAGVVGALTLQFLLTVVIAGLMYAQGEGAAHEVRRFGRRLGGQRGEDAVVLAGKAIRGVALGVGVTAIVQAVVGGIGLAIAGVPFAALLTAVMFILCIVQLGPTLVLAPATIWVFWHGDTGWSIFLLVWTLIVGTMDNFLRPMLIRRGADLPLLLIFAGVIGGLLGFGLVGIFVGPVLLAVSYTLMNAWLDSAEAPPPATTAPLPLPLPTTPGPTP
ncbi:AI-2E family transporter YdiK [Variovorax sp. J22P168]|uniref:AI-2E family transporter YdiK n=1 Tax=Variovorax jilinensis TaxID=3053513 RepID=UPI002579155C|nr:AI-2E family transporter YdiK [Variovorax sp. J22P168]MDM0014545.1 AI-2E family transporter YdiK [Variovorax sp. J22P168]